MAETVGTTCSEVWGGNAATEAALVLPGIQGWVVSRPYRGQHAGGDLHYVSSCGTGRITRVLLADAMGHGESASVLAQKLRNLMARYLNHISPHALARRMNHDVAGVNRDGGTFVTALVMTFYSPTGELSICNAGHPAPLLYRSNTRTWSPIDQPDTQAQIANLPLGVVEESGYVGRELVMQPGDVLLAFTDALTEARKGDGTMLGAASLSQALQNLPEDASASPSRLSSALIERLQSDGFDFDDDMTTVVLRCTERTGGAALGERLKGMVRFFVSPLRGGPWAIPEFSKANMLDPLLPKAWRSG